jgi:predicted membrane protein
MPFIDIEGKRNKKNIFRKNNDKWFSYLWKSFVLIALMFIIFFMVFQIIRLVNYYNSLKNEYERLASKKIELQKKIEERGQVASSLEDELKKKGVLLNDGGLYQMDIHNIP